MAGIAIHGFGRIGRTLLRAALRGQQFTPVSIYDIKDIPPLAALFEVDTNYGLWHEEVRGTDTGFLIGGREILYLNALQELPDWKSFSVDLARTSFPPHRAPPGRCSSSGGA